MRRAPLPLAFLVLLSGCLHFPAMGKETPKENPIAWGYVRSQAGVALKTNHHQAGPVRVGRGALVPVWKWEDKQGKHWAHVRVIRLDNLQPVDGWIESTQIEEVALAKFPTDAVLLRQLGGEFLDDYTSAHTQIARFLVQEGSSGQALICFLSSPVLATARLVAFVPASGHLVPGPSLEFPAAEMQAGITMAEVRDLLGDGNECLITREPFRIASETRGVNEVIRRIEGPEFRVLWKAPVEYRSLDAYPARLKVLQPAERNIGEPGTVARGEVTFRQQGSLYEPVWKGAVEFYVPGREEPVQSLPLEKVCPWNGTRFQPLQ